MGSRSAFAATAPGPTADSRFTLAAKPLRHRIWPQAMIALGLGLTVAWTGLLVYGLAKLVERAF
jgi:hypothetical protein